MTKSEYIIFLALLIEAYINKMQGIKLWLDGRANNRGGLAPKVDFTDYMKRWRFWEIKMLVPFTSEDRHREKNGDVWWRFSGRIDNFNRIRKEVMLVSSIRVFDESMSPYMPR